MSLESAPPVPAATSATYTEKLWPTLWIWVIVVGLSASGILVFIPIGPLAGYLAFAFMLLGISAALIASTPTVRVTATTLQVGRAHIDRAHIGKVTAYYGEDATAQRGTKLNGLAYLCIRGWIKPVVKIVITDPDDTTPYWLTSTRNPEHLVAALGGTPRA